MVKHPVRDILENIYTAKLADKKNAILAAQMYREGRSKEEIVKVTAIPVEDVGQWLVAGNQLMTRRDKDCGLFYGQNITRPESTQSIARRLPPFSRSGPDTA
jgi:hypothetical protein